MTILEHALADYVLCLAKNAEVTRDANDRSLYARYLADAAPMLALASKGATAAELEARLVSHSRLLSQTFLAGPENVEVSSSWASALAVK